MGREELTNPPRILPDARLPLAGTDREERVRPAEHRRAVILLLHPGCEACGAYAAQIASTVTDVPRAALRVVLPVDGELADATVFRDDAGSFARALGMSVPAVIVADEWGEIHFRQAAGPEHAFPDAAAVGEWLEHLATICPECQGEAY